MRAVLFLAATICTSACTSPAGPISERICLRSAVSIEKSDEIRSFILSESKGVGLTVHDSSSQFRELEHNSKLIVIQLQPRPLLPSFRARIQVNPSHGGSVVVVHSYDLGVPESVQKVVEGLKSRYAFSLVAPLSSADGGGCPPNGTGGSNAKLAP